MAFFLKTCEDCGSSLSKDAYFLTKSPFYKDGVLNLCRNCIARLLKQHPNDLVFADKLCHTSPRYKVKKVGLLFALALMPAVYRKTDRRYHYTRLCLFKFGISGKSTTECDFVKIKVCHCFDLLCLCYIFCIFDVFVVGLFRVP